jgi:hypothetical protein
LAVGGKPNKALALIPDHCGHTLILGHKRQNESYPQVVDKSRLKKVTKRNPVWLPPVWTGGMFISLKGTAHQ